MNILRVQYLIDKLGKSSKTHKVCEVIISPFADCFDKIMNYLF